MCLKNFSSENFSNYKNYCRLHKSAEVVLSNKCDNILEFKNYFNGN